MIVADREFALIIAAQYHAVVQVIGIVNDFCRLEGIVEAVDEPCGVMCIDTGNMDRVPVSAAGHLLQLAQWQCFAPAPCGPLPFSVASTAARIRFSSSTNSYSASYASRRALTK